MPGLYDVDPKAFMQMIALGTPAGAPAIFAMLPEGPTQTPDWQGG